MREDQWATYVTIDGTPVPGPGISWDATTGGDIDSDETKYRPGGMAKQISLGGNRTVANITVSKLLVEATDWAVLKTVQARVGRGAPMSVIRQPLDIDGNPFGDRLTYTGTLKTIIPPDHQSDGSAAGLWQAALSVDDCA